MERLQKCKKRTRCKLHSTFYPLPAAWERQKTESMGFMAPPFPPSFSQACGPLHSKTSFEKEEGRRGEPLYAGCRSLPES